MKERIYMASPTMHGEEQKFVQEAFDTNWIAPLGPNVNGFEREMEAYTGIAHCSALSAGTAALHLAVKLLEVGEGDTVICPSLTFAATVNPVAYEKGKIVFVDSEPETWNMSPQALKRALEEHKEAKAVIVAHLYGTPAKVDEIKALCEEYKVPLIEDAAESLGATYKGVQTGRFGVMAGFSFNGNKIITTSGGGMIASENEEYIKHATFLATTFISYHLSPCLSRSFLMIFIMYRSDRSPSVTFTYYHIIFPLSRAYFIYDMLYFVVFQRR